MNTLYRKVPSLLVNKLAQVFTSGEFIFIEPTKSKVDGGISLMYLCDKHDITEELRCDNIKEELIPGATMLRIMSNFYIIGRSSDPYNQQHNKCEGQIRDLEYLSKQRMIKTNAPAPLWEFCIFTESEIISRISRGGKRTGL